MGDVPFVAILRMAVIVAIGICAGFAFHSAAHGLLASLVSFLYTELKVSE